MNEPTETPSLTPLTTELDDAPLQPCADGRDQPFPLLLQPKGTAEDLIQWARAHRPLLDRLLVRFGALLFRGFNVCSAESFARLIEASSSTGWVDYRERMTPRKHVSGHIWTSTEYPPSQTIYPHNENSHCTSWPLKLFFNCHVAAESGGETPLVDCRKLTASIPGPLRDEFTRRGWMYTRSFHFGVGFTWQSVYQVETPAELEQYCRENEMTPCWEEDKLTVRYVRSALVRHPRTHEALWFNHGTFYHPSTLEPALYRAMRARFAPEEFTYYSCFGDGAPVPDDVAAQLRDLYARCRVTLPWQRGDVLLLDNMLAAHGRSPFRGERSVLVGMSDLVQRSEVELSS
jgi:alpha-ketoglutarate-dependent taurine dioxygenase